jgi:hypothetical protein
MKYKYWFDLERHLDKCFFKIRELSGDISQEESERLFDKYIVKYFKVWDDMSCAVNADYGFSPVYFAWWAEQNCIQPTFPIRICRAAAQFFLN